MLRYFLFLSLLIYINAIGEYIPQLDINGTLKPKQCWGSTGTCWCIYGPNAYNETKGELNCPPEPVIVHNSSENLSVSN